MFNSTDTLQNVPVSPFAAVNQVDVRKAMDGRGEKSLAELQTESDEVFGKLQKAWDESEQGKSYGKIKVFGEGTATEVMAKILSAHTDMAAINHVMSSKRMLEVASQDHVNNHGGGVMPTDVVPAWGSARLMPSFGERAVEAFKAAGHSFKIGAPLQPTAIEINLRDGGWDRIMGTAFQEGASSGAPAFVTREPGYVPIINRPLTAWDVFTKYMTTQASLKYIQETTRTNAATPKAENAAAGEATSVFEEQTVPIQRIPVTIPITEEALLDVDEVQNILNQVLSWMVLNTAETQALTGNGTAPNWTGISGATGVLSQDLAGAGSPTRVIKDIALAMAKIRNDGEAMASAVILNPTAWTTAMIEEATGGGGLYLGNPGAGFMPMIWGLPVAQSTAYAYTTGAKNVGVVGGFDMWAAVALLQNVLVEMDRAGSDFTHFRYTLRASLRGALKVTRPKAFCHLRKTA